MKFINTFYPNNELDKLKETETVETIQPETKPVASEYPEYPVTVDTSEEEFSEVNENTHEIITEDELDGE